LYPNASLEKCIPKGLYEAIEQDTPDEQTATHQLLSHVAALFNVGARCLSELRDKDTLILGKGGGGGSRGRLVVAGDVALDVLHLILVFILSDARVALVLFRACLVILNTLRA
jgi:hypothetical protein